MGWAPDGNTFLPWALWMPGKGINLLVVCGQLPTSTCQDWHGGYHHSREEIGRPECSTLRKDKPRLILFSFPFYGSIFDIQHRFSF